MSFARALPVILKAEGGYVHNPNDPGGETNFGITRATYEGWRKSQQLPVQSVKLIAPAEVEAIYHTRYWTAGQCDALPWPLALVHFDACVNHGIGTAAKLLQRAVGATQDGRIGPQTIAAAHGTPGAATTYLVLRLRFYCDIVKQRPASTEFLRGWVLRMVHLFEGLA